MKHRFRIEGMTCAACVAHVEKATRKVDGVKEASVNLLTNSMEAEYDDDSLTEKIENAISKAGYKAIPVGESGKKEAPSQKESDVALRKMVYRLVASVVILVPLFYLAMGAMLGWNIGVLHDYPLLLGLLEMVLSFAIMAINYHYFASGIKSLFRLSPNMDTLVALGSGVAFIYSVALLFEMAYYVSAVGYADPSTYHTVMEISMNLNFETAGTVVALITVGKTLEAYSKGKTTSAINSLLSLAPKIAHRKEGDKVVDVPSDKLKAGDLLLIYPGESFPADGKIESGKTSVDESSLTGESMPVDKKEGDEAYTGTINQTGSVSMKVTKTGEETTLSQIVKMVEEASSTKAPIARLADKVSGVFVPIVIGIALVVFVFWMILGGDLVRNSGLVDGENLFTYALERGISVLVISCPCALGLATPVGIMVGSGKGAKNGILFKTATSLEETGKVSIAVLDKTGTITEGKPKLTALLPSNMGEDEFLSLAYSIERGSEHPLAKAIKEAAEEKGIKAKEASSFESIPGKGVRAEIDGTAYYAGNASLLESLNAYDEEARKTMQSLSMSGKTPLLFAKQGEYLGAIGVEDAIKEDSVQAIAELRKLGVEPVMLTGDNPIVAKSIADKVGITHFAASLMPGDKLTLIKKLKEKGKVAMIGDGINDAPSLTEADIGMAIGSGSDIAIDSADVVIASSRLSEAAKAIRLSRKTLLNIKENLFWAFFYNLIMIPIAAGVFVAAGMAKMRPWMGAAAMSLSSVTVVLNALRLNLVSLGKGANRKPKAKLDDGMFLTSSCPIDIEEKEDKPMKIALKVTGMMCQHCVAHVTKALEGVEGVSKVEVSLQKGEAQVTGEGLDKAKLIAAVNEAGYKAE